MQQEKKSPQRKCMGCNEMKDKRALVRIVRNKEGEVSLDLTGKANGRGAYLCRETACLEKARKARRLERALQTKIPDAVYEALIKELETNGAG